MRTKAGAKPGADAYHTTLGERHLELAIDSHFHATDEVLIVASIITHELRRLLPQFFLLKEAGLGSAGRRQTA